jgi:signal transduction histidine kinase
VNHYETVRVDKQGRFIDISVTISPMRNSQGQIVGASKIARDISERRRFERIADFIAAANDALAEPNDYEHLLKAVASIAVPLFADWCFVDRQVTGGAIQPLAIAHEDAELAQKARERLLQRPARTTDRRGPGNVLRSGRSEILQDIGAVMAADPSPRQDEYLRILRDLGVTSYVSVLLRPISEAQSTLTFAMAESGRRVTAADLDAAEDLAHRAVIGIENAGLLNALREADRRKDDFLAILAHELRNPLSPIRNAVQLLRDPHSSQVDREFAVGVMDRQIQQMSRLVEDLLDVARISRGKIELRKERIELATVIVDAVETTRPLMEAQGHELTLEIQKEPIVLHADPTRIAQVMSNLMNNAAKYTRPGGRIWLTAREDDGEAVIAVRDTGIGIPAEMLTRIFDMFTQVEHSMEGARSGLGIGLTLVQRLVEMHGGTIRVTSPGRDQGSLFVVRLPLAGRAVGPARSSGSEDPGKTTTGHRVLVVDDNRDGAESLGLLLRRIAVMKFASSTTVPRRSRRRTSSIRASCCSTSGCRR